MLFVVWVILLMLVLLEIVAFGLICRLLTDLIIMELAVSRAVMLLRVYLAI